MGPLRNPRHEAFARALFEGKSATEAYQLAGYHPHDGNAARLRGNERIVTRLSELQEAAAKTSEVTVRGLNQLEDVCVRASALNQLGTVVKAVRSQMRARRCGAMLRDKQLTL